MSITQMWRILMRKDQSVISERVTNFWRKVDAYFKETVRVGFDHSSEWESDTVIRQLRKIVEGKFVYVCDTGRSTLPMSGFDKEWKAVGAYLEKTDYRPRRDVLAELKLVASGIRDDQRLTESCQLLPLY